jgi:tetratricopeptide (TPR) repeat protein
MAASDTTANAATETGPGVSASYLAAPTITRGTPIDRYLVIEKVGAGGMGVVYAAYDPQLDRRVAVKLVRDGDHAGANARRDRLLLEARAMAKLDHHNVVRVFDAGTCTVGGSEQIFVAMELVDGEPLGTWSKVRPWRENLHALIDAGRGLAAAHAAGVVHRDFKPDNVLVDRGGRARVGDFGLASHESERDAAGAIMGTPAFMAPEQHRGDPVDARADQFAFCVTAWLVLFRAHPFARDDLREAVLAGEIEDPPRNQLPGWIEPLLRRGLAVDPASRHPSLGALLDELATRARPRRWPIAAAAVVLAGGIAIPVLALRDAEVTTCPAATERLAVAWSEPARQALRARGINGAATAAALDGYAKAWSALHTETCTTKARAPSATVARREACLDLRLAQLGEVATRLRGANDDLLPQGVALVEAMPAPRACADPTTVQHDLLLPDDPTIASRVTAARAALAVAHALAETGRFDDATAALAKIDPAALAFQPFAAETAEVRANLEASRGDIDKSMAAYDEAIRTATAAGHDTALVRLLLDRAYELIGDKTLVEVERWYSLAEAMIVRLGDPAELRVHLHGNRVQLRRKQTKVDLAVEDARRAYELAREHAGPASPAAAKAAAALGAALYDFGKETEARAVFADTLRTAEQILPADHYVIQNLLHNLVGLQIRLKDTVGARANLERLTASLVRVYGADHARVEKVRLELGTLLGTEGKHAESVAVLETVLAAARRRHGDTAIETAMIRHNLAISLDRASRGDEAEVQMTSVLEIVEKTLGAEHPATMSTQTSLGYMLYRHGKLPRAEELLRKAVALAVKILPPDSPGGANPNGSLALVLSARGDHNAARRHALRAIELARDKKPAIHAEGELALAHALHGLGDRKGAVAAANRSLELYRALGEAAAEDRRVVETWLAAH